MFGTNFLPTPTYIENFKKTVKGTSGYYDMSSRLLMAREDVFEAIKSELHQSDWSETEKTEYLSWCATLPVWVDQALTTKEQIIEAIEAAAETEELHQEAGIPSPSEKEKALAWVQEAEFSGSEKQIKWAKDIASKHAEAIVFAWKKGYAVPTSAKWWIENNRNIVVSLPLL